MDLSRRKHYGGLMASMFGEPEQKPESITENHRQGKVGVESERAPHYRDLFEAMTKPAESIQEGKDTSLKKLKEL